jgi:putative membrane protein
MSPRRPPLREVGNDPDYRFTLANERTFLAWLRTGLALVAGAVALQSLAPQLGPGQVRTGLIAVLLALATVVTLGAYRRWDRAERALRQDQSLPIGSLPRIVAGGVAVVILGAFLLVLLAGIDR